MPNRPRQSFVCSLSFSGILLSVSSRAQIMCLHLSSAPHHVSPPLYLTPRVHGAKCKTAIAVFNPKKDRVFYGQSTHCHSPKDVIYSKSTPTPYMLHTTMHTHMLLLAPRLLPEVILATSQSCTGIPREGRTHHPSLLFTASHYVRVQVSPPTIKNV